MKHDLIDILAQNGLTDYYGPLPGLAVSIFESSPFFQYAIWGEMNSLGGHEHIFRYDRVHLGKMRFTSGIMWELGVTAHKEQYAEHPVFFVPTWFNKTIESYCGVPICPIEQLRSDESRVT